MFLVWLSQNPKLNPTSLKRHEDGDPPTSANVTEVERISKSEWKKIPKSKKPCVIIPKINSVEKVLPLDADQWVWILVFVQQ